MKNDIENNNKQIARHTLRLFDGKPKVQQYLHDTINLSIDILSVNDSPEVGITSYSTIGLFKTILSKGNKPFETRIELCGAMPSSEECWGNIMASVSFALMRSKQIILPGSVMENYVSGYYPDTTVPHLYFTIPYLWNDNYFEELTLHDKIKVNWLQCISISESELRLLQTLGSKNFEDKLQQADIDLFDLNRITLE